MINNIGVSDVLQSLRPTADWVLRGDTLDWLDTIQSEPTTAEITAEITRLESLEPQRLINIESLAYLASTDWYVTRKFETGVAIPQEVLIKRQESRLAVI